MKKTLELNYEGEKIEVLLAVGCYTDSKNIYIGIYYMDDGEPELFDDLTVALPNSTLELNEGFISGDLTREKLDLIQKYNLGKILNERGCSEFAVYSKVAFDLEKIAEYDSEGVEEYLKSKEV